MLNCIVITALSLENALRKRPFIFSPYTKEGKVRVQISNITARARFSRWIIRHSIFVYYPLNPQSKKHQTRKTNSAPGRTRASGREVLSIDSPPYQTQKLSSAAYILWEGTYFPRYRNIRQESNVRHLERFSTCQWGRPGSREFDHAIGCGENETIINRYFGLIPLLSLSYTYMLDCQLIIDHIGD